MGQFERRLERLEAGGQQTAFHRELQRLADRFDVSMEEVLAEFVREEELRACLGSAGARTAIAGEFGLTPGELDQLYDEMHAAMSSGGLDASNQVIDRYIAEGRLSYEGPRGGKATHGGRNR